MPDPLVAVVGVSVLGPAVAGPAVAYGLDRVPREWRRTTEWLVIGGAALFAVVADLLWEGPVGGGCVFVLAALPGLLAFLAWRTLLASTLVSFVPLYFAIAILTRSRPTYAPEVALDRAWPLEPAWMLVYGSLYLFVVVMPLLVVRERDLWRRAMKAYLTVMILAYAGFLLYPTAAPRPEEVNGEGFAAWALRLAYSLDPPYNCFPSLHVAYAFVSALTCYRVHREVGVAALCWAALIGASTLYTKQHYVVDVVAGAASAFIAYVVFLRTYPRAAVSDDRRRAPMRALLVAGMFAAMIAGFWVAYLVENGTFNGLASR